MVVYYTVVSVVINWMLAPVNLELSTCGKKSLKYVINAIAFIICLVCGVVRLKWIMSCIMLYRCCSVPLNKCLNVNPFMNIVNNYNFVLFSVTLREMKGSLKHCCAGVEPLLLLDIFKRLTLWRFWFKRSIQNIIVEINTNHKYYRNKSNPPSSVEAHSQLFITTFT